MSDYYIDGSTGNDSNPGTSEGSGNAWKTIGKAATTISAGDRVFVKASASYAESPDFSGTDGTISTPIVVEGYTSSVGDGGRAVITSDASTADTLHVGNFYSVRNFTVTGGPNPGETRGIRIKTFCVVENCEVDGQSDTDRGIDMNNGSYAVGCYVHDCTFAGFHFFSVGGVLACIADTCVTGFFNNSTTYGYFYCIARGNTLTGMRLSSNSAASPMINCTVDALTPGSATGYTLGQGNNISIAINCVAINCFLGFNMGAPADTEYNFSYNNCVFGNTSDYSAAGRTVAGEITTDPKFVDESAKDYGPDTGSPLIAAGYDAKTNVWLPMTGDPIDVGALQSEAGGPNFAGAFLNWGVN